MGRGLLKELGLGAGRKIDDPEQNHEGRFCSLSADADLAVALAVKNVVR